MCIILALHNTDNIYTVHNEQFKNLNINKNAENNIQ